MAYLRTFISTCIGVLFLLVCPTLGAPLSIRQSTDHLFTLVNKCTDSVTPVFANTMCGYSPRCTGAAAYTGAQPGSLDAGATTTVTVPYAWVGRVYNEISACGDLGWDCTVTEFNLDTGSEYTAQNYDISNIQGFTQSIGIAAAGCDTVACTSADCGCSEAYPVGDESGCGDNLADRACGAGNIAFTVTFCP